MNINAEKIVAISEANQNFSKTARLADKLGEVFIFKNNKPKYRLVVINDEVAAVEEAAPEVNEKKLKRILKIIKRSRKSLEELLRLSSDKG